jgi:alkylresorcinol/alkylpyrone synthase
MEGRAQIIGVETVFPPHLVEQSTLTDAIKEKWQDFDLNTRVVDKLHGSSQVKKRHIALSVENCVRDSTFAERNGTYIEVGVDLAEKVVSSLLEKSGVKPREISEIIFTTVTGLAVPSIEARLMNRLPFSPHCKRIPMFGLGCVAGAAGVARAADYLRGNPDDLVVLLALELCSLTFQNDDISMANIVATGLFGDGAAAVLLAGKNRAATLPKGPRVIDSRSFFFPNSERVMGWDITENGFKIVLSAEVPSIAKEKIPRCVDELLAAHHIHRSDVAAWIAHPGGPKVMQGLSEGLNLPPDALRLSHESLSEEGNLSSASVLLILQKTLAQKSFRPGDFGVMLAMGPAFCAEVVLLQW